MDTQKYNQYGGEQAIYSEASNYMKGYSGVLGTYKNPNLPPPIPHLSVSETYKSGLKAIQDEAEQKQKAKPLVFAGDKKLSNDALLSGSIEHIYDNMKVFSGNTKKIDQDGRSYNAYNEQMNKIFNLYVPMREEIFPGYAKNVREVKYKINTEENLIENKITGSDKPTKQKNFEQILRNVLFMFNHPAKGKGGKSIFTNFADFLNEGEVKDKSIEDVINNMEGDDSIKELINRTDDDAFKLMSVFAWRESGKLLTHIEKEEAEILRKHGEADQEASSDNKAPSGGGPESMGLVNPGTQLRNRRRMMIFICLISFLFNGMLLYEQFINMSGFITRIMDIRQQYINDGIGDLGETESGNVLFSAYNVLWQLMTVGMFAVIGNIHERSTTMATSFFSSTIRETQVQNSMLWNRGLTTYINDLLNGNLYQTTASETSAHLTNELTQFVNSIARETRTMTNNARSIHSGLISSLSGLVTTTTLLLHAYNPRLITQEHVSGSIAIHGQVFFSPTNVISIYTASTNFTALVSRLGYVYLNGIENGETPGMPDTPDTPDTPGTPDTPAHIAPLRIGANIVSPSEDVDPPAEDEVVPNPPPTIESNEISMDEQGIESLLEAEGIGAFLDFFNSTRPTDSPPKGGGKIRHRKKKGKNTTYKKKHAGKRSRSYRKK